MWHEDPRPMLRSATLDEGGPQTSVWPRRVIEVLCDDGLRHKGVLECWHEGLLGWECLISWYAAPFREYSGWYGYRAAAIRPTEAPDNDHVARVADQGKRAVVDSEIL